MALRWKRRRRGWVGFAGTSRKPVASIKRSGGGWTAIARHHSWWAARSWKDAADWCEQQLAPPTWRPTPTLVLVVYADGKAERRPLERLMPALAMFERPKNLPLSVEEWGQLQSHAIEQVVMQGNWWQMTYEYPMAGIAGTIRVMVYAHPRCPSPLVKRAALEEIHRRRHMLDEAIHVGGGRYGDSRELQQLAERICDGELI